MILRLWRSTGGRGAVRRKRGQVAVMGACSTGRGDPRAHSLMDRLGGLRRLRHLFRSYQQARSLAATREFGHTIAGCDSGSRSRYEPPPLKSQRLGGPYIVLDRVALRSRGHAKLANLSRLPDAIARDRRRCPRPIRIQVEVRTQNSRGPVPCTRSNPMGSLDRRPRAPALRKSRQE